MADIYPFSEQGCTADQGVWERSGRRGERALELAEMKLPIVPGYIIDARVTPRMAAFDLRRESEAGLRLIEQGIGRKFGDPANPLLLKVVCSSQLKLPMYPTVFNVGLSSKTIDGFARIIGEQAAWFEYAYLLRTAGTKLHDLPEEKFDEIQKKHAQTVEGNKACAMEMLEYVGRDKVPDDPLEQLEVIVKNAAARYFDPAMDDEDSLGIMVQGMVFGNIGENSSVGTYFTRDIISGEDRLQGRYLLKSYTIFGKQGEDIHTLDAGYLNKLKEIADSIERKFKEIREVKFIVENGKLWVINQTPVDKKSTQSHIRTLLDLMKRGHADESWVVGQIPPGQLATLLHRIIEPASIEDKAVVRGGMVGAPGAAVGRVCFSADKLMEAHRDALLKGEDTRLLLVVESSFAEDVKAIEVGQGVISIEGGYSSHAPVVARSMGKVSIVNSKIRIDGNSFTLDGHTVREGDYVTLDCPVYREPAIMFGKAELINPDINKNGLVEFIGVIKKFITPDFVVRANADLGRDAKVAMTMGAYGIGLCRTEHMFFADDRISRFREMILAEDLDARVAALSDLRSLQAQDFYDLFVTMAPFPVTIRLLDAPLHEFLPRSDDVFESYCTYLSNKGVTPNRQLIKERIERLHEFNPMLGHRGCRVGITYPEIYEMQVRAIFDAAVRLKQEGKEVVPEIMIPLVMTPGELTFIKNGKRIEGKYIKGIRDVAREMDPNLKYKVGTMIELPAAALLSNELARYAEFFSYGTNDLTQTTNGLSRDDANSFFPTYTEFDILANNPFQVLGQPVKELIGISAQRGRITRPDIKLGLCGEHGADPANIEFCRAAGLDYVSCSPYSVPIALLAVAQTNIKKPT